MASPGLVRKETLRVLRGLIRELRHAKPGTSPRNMMAYQYLKQEFKRNQVTPEQYCRAQEDMLHKAKLYLCMLQSVREHEILQQEYKGGERSIEESARLVGLQLPPKPPSD